MPKHQITNRLIAQLKYIKSENIPGLPICTQNEN